MNNIILTDEQEHVIQEAINWFNNDNEQIFEISAVAGCGKSLILHIIIERLGLFLGQVLPVSFTGSAVLVMRLNGFLNAKTIHSAIYKATIDKNNIQFNYKGLDPHIVLIVIDEASMVNNNLKEDLLKTGCKIIAAGDNDQLPPVLSSEPAFFKDKEKIHYLTKIMRQAENSAIVQVSNLVKNNKIPNLGIYNNGEVCVIDQSTFFANLESIAKSYDIVLACKNSTRDHLNNTIRSKVFGYNSPFPYKNEPLISRKNDWSIELDGINLVNGLYGTTTKTVSISDYHKEGYFDLNFKPHFMNEYFENLKCDYNYFISDYQKRKELRTPFSGSNYKHAFFEYAYCISTHLSQGSQYNSGVYFQEYIPNVPLNKLNYTGITRFRNKCIYVVPDKKQYYHY